VPTFRYVFPMIRGLRKNGKCLLAASALVGAVATILAGAGAYANQAMSPPKVTASSVFVVNADTGQTLYAKNETKSYWILSLTKLTTAYVAVERMGGQLADPVTVTKADLTSGSSAGLRVGDIWSLKALLYGMLLVSGNDAALAIADHVGQAILANEKKQGNAIKRFVEQMGATAASLGANHTQFADPYGLSPSNVSTAHDIGLIGSKVFRDARLLPFWKCARRTVNVGGPQARTVTIVSTIDLIGENDILGAKTGTHVGKNINHLVAGWRAPNGQTIVAVVLGAASQAARHEDMRTILAALPKDFPGLAVPAPPTSGETADDGSNDCAEH
jgi:serine-type D-Ala-D-Ala carboxypeptidase (penicillin-binding protein 5/6)